MNKNSGCRFAETVHIFQAHKLEVKDLLSQVHNRISMNRSTCSSTVWACDEAFLLPVITGNTQILNCCDVPVALFGFFLSFAGFIKFFIGLGMTYFWKKRRVKIMTSGTRNQKKQEQKRLPVVPILVFSCSATYIIAAILMVLDIASVRNGFSYFFYGIVWTLLNVMTSIYLLKVVSLGRKLAPVFQVSRTFSSSDGNDNTHATVISVDPLTILTEFQKVVLVAQAIALLVQAVIFIIFTPIFPHSVSLILTGLGFQGLGNISQFVGIFYHLQRVHTFVRTTYNQAQTASQGQFYQALKRLRIQQITILVSTVPSGVVCFLQCAQVLSTNWYLFMIPTYLDVVANFGFLFSNMIKPERAAQPNNTAAVVAVGAIHSTDNSTTQKM